MRESDREFIFTGISRLCQSLISECEVLCEFIDDEGDVDSITRHIASLEDEADNIKHDIQFYYQDNRLYKDQECMILLEIVSAVEECTDKLYDIAKTFIRLNIPGVKDNIVSSFISAGTGAVRMAELMNSIRILNRADTPVRAIIELDHFSVEYNKIYEINMKKLYVDGADPLEVMRWTAVYDAFKRFFESYENVAEACGKYCLVTE